MRHLTWVCSFETSGTNMNYSLSSLIISLLACTAYAEYDTYPVAPPKLYNRLETTVDVSNNSDSGPLPPFLGGNPTVLLAPTTPDSCVAQESSHFCGDIPVELACVDTSQCTNPSTAGCEINALKLEKSDLTYIRVKEEPPCCCVQICMDDVECDGVENNNGKCWLLTGRNKPSWIWNVTQPKSLSSIYVKTYMCNDIPPKKADLSLARLQGRSVQLVHTVGTTAGSGGIIDNAFYVCYAKVEVAECDLLPFGTDKNNRELVVDGDIDKPLGYCARSRGNCGATEELTEWSHTLRYDKIYRVPGFDNRTLEGLYFKDSGLLPCYFWPNRYDINC